MRWRRCMPTAAATPRLGRGRAGFIRLSALPCERPDRLRRRPKKVTTARDAHGFRRACRGTFIAACDGDEVGPQWLFLSFPNTSCLKPYQGASPNSRFLAGAVPASETSWQSYGQRLAGSVLTHIVGLLVVLFVATRLPAVSPSEPASIPPPDITWIASPGPGGGGGGGGNKMPDPPRKAEIVAPKPRTFTPPPPKPEVTPPKPQPQMNIPAVTAVQELPGAVSQLPDATIAQGAGIGGGGGTGTGSASDLELATATAPAPAADLAAAHTAKATASPRLG